MTKSILALDIGTQSTRAALVTIGGDILGVAQIAHEVDSPHPNWAQQQPTQWWDEACRAIQDVLRETATPPQDIVAVAACGQMHGPVGVDESGNVTTPWVQLWCDKRCQPYCEELCARSDASELTQISSNQPFPSWIGIKVRWYHEHEPENYDRARWFLVSKDFINLKLTGVAATDPSEASGSFLMDWKKEAYSTVLAEAVGVDVDRFAPIHRANEVIGDVTEAAANETGLAPGTPVVSGGGDFPVAMLGFGAVGHGVAADVSGSSSLLGLHTPEPVINPSVQNLRHVADGWTPYTILDAGGLSVAWCRDFFRSAGLEDFSYDALADFASAVPAGSDGLVYYPYLLGERRPENARARGAFHGITLNHTASHFARAVLEGVALGYARDVALVRSFGHTIDHILCVGGGGRSSLWNQIKADAIGARLEISPEPEAGLKGAALLGASGAGLIGDPAAVAIERRHAGEMYEPRAEDQALYAKALAEYTRFYDHMLGYWQEQD